MCAPVVAGVAIAGVALQAYSQYQQGKAGDQVARNNATLAGYQRSDAKQQGALEAGNILAEGRNVGSSARVAVTANGLDPYSGSMADGIANSGAAAAVDAVRARSHAARAAWGLTNEQNDLRAQGRMAKKAGVMGAFGTGLSGAGSVAGTYASAKGTT